MQWVCHHQHHSTGTGSTPGTGTSASPGPGGGGSTGTLPTTTRFTGTGATSTGTTGTGQAGTGATGTGHAGTSHAGTGASGTAGTSSPRLTPKCSNTTKALAAIPANGLSLTTAQLAGLVTLAVILGAVIAGLVPWFIRRRHHPWIGP